MLKVYVNKSMSNPVYKDGKLIGYIEYTEDGLQREIPFSNKYKIVLV